MQLDLDLPEPIRPLAWLIGTWEGAGVVGYPTMERSYNFGQRIECAHDGRGFLSWQSRSWLLTEDGAIDKPSAVEFGFWRPADSGGQAAPGDPVEVELLLTHPTGLVEMYAGQASPARIDIVTDSVMRSRSAKEYAGAHRLYGLVDSDLMWVMDMAAMGHALTSHVSAQLKRIE